MLKEERHSFILEELRLKKKVLTYELSEALEVSEDTIRRDLKELAEINQIKKVHGGAVSHSLNPYDYKDRQIFAQDEKIQIAEKARHLIKPHQVVIMDGGTTNLELAKRLPRELEATIFTNSLPIAVELSDHPKVETIFLGGKLLKKAQVTVGEEVTQMLDGLRADLSFLGTRSLDHEKGITEIDREETRIKRAIIAASQAMVSLVIAEKLGTEQPYKIGETSQISTLVTSLDPQDKRLAPFRSLGIEVL